MHTGLIVGVTIVMLLALAVGIYLGYTICDEVHKIRDKRTQQRLFRDMDR